MFRQFLTPLFLRRADKSLRISCKVVGIEGEWLAQLPQQLATEQ